MLTQTSHWKEQALFSLTGCLHKHIQAKHTSLTYRIDHIAVGLSYIAYYCCHDTLVSIVIANSSTHVQLVILHTCCILIYIYLLIVIGLYMLLKSISSIVGDIILGNCNVVTS